MKTDADWDAEAEARFQADKAAMEMVELPPEVKAWLQGMWDQAKALKRGYDERECMYLNGPEREIRQLLDECRMGVVRFNESIFELRATLAKIQRKSKPALTVVKGGKGTSHE
jgi:hypothetical protein